MSWLKVEGVSNQVLRGVDLGVGRGELMAVVGPSGAGKTSLLKVIAGLMPHEGRVWFGNRDVSSLAPHRRRVGMIFQDQWIFPHLSVAGNVMLALRAVGVARHRRRELAMRLLEVVGLGGMGGGDPSVLSGGQRQRLALARALACRPRVLLMDEPFNSLDLPAARALRRLVQRVHEALGLTTIVVTHSIEEALSLGQRVGVMKEGRIVKLWRTSP